MGEEFPHVIPFDEEVESEKEDERRDYNDNDHRNHRNHQDHHDSLNAEQRDILEQYEFLRGCFSEDECPDRAQIPENMVALYEEDNIADCGDVFPHLMNGLREWCDSFEL